MPHWNYRLWSDDDNETIVSKAFPQYLKPFKAIKRGVVRADIARYIYLYAYGGFYFDTDYKLLRPINATLLSHSCILPISRDSEPVFRLGNAVLGSQPEHAFWKDFIDHIFSSARLDNLREDGVEKTTGPEGLTHFYLRRKPSYPDVYLAPRTLFHPKVRCMGFLTDKTPMTFGVHLCWGSWRTKNTANLIRVFAARKITSYL